MSRDPSDQVSSVWLGGLGALFGRVARKSAAKKQPHQRKLRIEPLETRTMLSAAVLGSIGGVAFYDVKGDGLTADDVRLPNVTVKLYQDGGNGVFDGSTAGGDDTLVASTLTDSSGNYHFNNLSPGKSFVPAIASNRVRSEFGYWSQYGEHHQQRPERNARSSHRLVRHQFAGRRLLLDRTNCLIDGQHPGRDRRPAQMLVKLTTPYGSVAMGANTDIPGMLDFSSGSASNGLLEIVWDGPGSDAQHLNPNGLNNVDLTAGNTSTGIELALGADHNGGTAVLTIYSDATDWSSATITIPNTDDGTANQEMFVPFTNFTVGGGTGANFSKVGAVQLNINGPNAVDGQIGSIETVGPKVFTCNFANLAQTDLGIVKSESPAPAVAGQPLTYTLTVTNNGPSNATGVTVTDPLPAALSFVSATPSQGSVERVNGVLTIHLGNLADGASATTTVVATVAAATSGTVTNTATVTGNETDPNLANNTSTVVTPLSAQTDLQIAKSGSPDPVKAGQQLTYTLTSRNNGPSNATGVTVVDTLPAGVSFVSGSSSRGTVSFANGTVTVGLGNLAVGATASSTIIVGVNSTTTGNITNTAVISGNESDTNLANNRASVTTEVDQPVVIQGNPDIDLAITKAALPNPVDVGSNLTYTLTVTNLSANTATGVTVVDTLPAGLSVVSTSSSQGTVTTVNGVVHVSLGTLAQDGRATVTIVTMVNSTAPSSLSNTASVSGDETDSDPSNNQATVVTQVVQPLSKRRFLGR